MKPNKDIESHIDQLLKQAENPPILKTSDGFLNRLNNQIDEMESQPAKTVLLFTDLLKYAAVIFLTILNLGAIYSLSMPDSTSVETTDSLAEVAEEYFPDYTAYAEME